MMKRTEKCIANSRQKSMANSQARQEQSLHLAKQTKGLRPRQGEVRGEVHYRGKAAVSQPVPRHPRTDANVQQGQQGPKELKLEEGIAKIPEIDFNEEIVEYKRIIQAAQQLKTATTSRKTPQRQHQDCMTKYNEVHPD